MRLTGDSAYPSEPEPEQPSTGVAGGMTGDAAGMALGLAAQGTAALAAVEALGLDGHAAVEVRRTPRRPIAYDPFLPGRSVERVRGTAMRAPLPDPRGGAPRAADGAGGGDGAGDAAPDSATDPGAGAGDPGDPPAHGAARATWSAVVKRTEGIGLRAARRELASYRSGLAPQRDGPGLRAPRLLAFEATDDHVELWLEELEDELDGRWSAERFGAAADHVAGWAARLRHDGSPAAFDAEDGWAERHGQPHRVPEALDLLDSARAASAAEEAMTVLDDPGFRRTEALVTSTVRRIERLAALPRTMLHHDLVRSNLFALSPRTTAAVDWENVGPGPLGVDLAPLVGGSVRRGDASGDDLEAIEEAALDGYRAGLRGAGVDARDMREAYELAVGLRWHTVLGTIGSCLARPTSSLRGSRPEEPVSESLRHLALLSRRILRAGDAAG